MRHRSRFIAALTLAAVVPGPTVASAPAAHGDVSATVTGLRSTHGQVLACLTHSSRRFPNCAREPEARKLVVPAGLRVDLDFGQVPAGTYAIALVHDENSNGKLDKRLIMPSEGFGFSRDAPVRLGPPSFGEAAFAVREGEAHQSIRMRYLF